MQQQEYHIIDEWMKNRISTKPSEAFHHQVGRQFRFTQQKKVTDFHTLEMIKWTKTNLLSSLYVLDSHKLPGLLISDQPCHSKIPRPKILHCLIPLLHYPNPTKEMSQNISNRKKDNNNNKKPIEKLKPQMIQNPDKDSKRRRPRLEKWEKDCCNWKQGRRRVE